MTLLLTRRDVAELLPMTDCIAAVEGAFRAHAEGRTLGPALASVHVEGGGFHIKAAGLVLSRPYFAAKTNGNFFNNDARQLPRIQGTIALCDASTGSPLAVLDSIEITIRRTAAATIVAASRLARPDSAGLGLIGCGTQGHATWAPLLALFPITDVWLFDTNPDASAALAKAIGRSHVTPHVCTSARDVARRADICVTATPATAPLLALEDLRPGAFVAAVGADSEVKQELDPSILHASRVIVDHREQAAAIGEVHHAVDAAHPADDVIVGTLGEVITGMVPGRTTDQEIIIFDSTGTALQDVAAAAIVYERATQLGRGVSIDFAAAPLA